MHGSLDENSRLISGVLKNLESMGERDSSSQLAAPDVAICVPFPYLAQMQLLLSGTKLQFGAQDLSTHALGAYTGEVSASMLLDFGCKWVLCGHSERRAYHSETSVQVASKAKLALDSDLHAVVCVGETMAERNDGLVERVISAQLAPILTLKESTNLTNLVIAYEPVWAIGTGHTASPEQAQQVHAFIRQELNQRGLNDVRILYGGSVKPENANTLFTQPDIDGALVGGASLDAKSFAEIVLATNL